MPEPLFDSSDTITPAQAATANPGGTPQAVDSPGGNIVSLFDDSDKRKQKFLGQDIALTKQQIGAEAAMAAKEQERQDSYDRRMEEANAAEGASLRDLKPWNAQQEMAANRTDLWSQLGSPGFVVGMLASAFTGAPMYSALNAGAAAMNAINQGDTAAYNKAFEAWKDNSNLAIKRSDIEQREFENIAKLKESNLAEWQTQAKLLLLRFNDQRKLALLENGFSQEFDDAQRAEWDSMRAYAQAVGPMLETKALFDALNGSVDANGNRTGGDPRWYKGTDMMGAYTDAVRKLEEAKAAGRYGIFSPGAQKAREKEDIKADIQAAHPDWTPGQVDLEADKQQSRATTRSAQGMALGAFIDENPDASPQEIQAFIQSGRAGRSGVSIYLNKFLQEHPNASSAEIKDAFQKFQTQVTAQNRFLSGPQGNTIRSLNVVVSHLQVMQDMVNALDNGDIVAFNHLAQDFASATGSQVPTNFDTAKRIVGAEIIKALGVAGAGTEGERAEAGDAFERARSPEQLYGAIETARRLLVGQLSGLRRQFTTSTGLESSVFDDMLEPSTRTFFDRASTTSNSKNSVGVPKAFAADPDGTRYQKDGKTWIKQGDRLIEQ